MAEDYSTTRKVFDKLDSTPNLLNSVRFIIIKDDPCRRLFQMKKVGDDWVVDRVQDKPTLGAPFELVGSLCQEDSQHAYFEYDQTRFVGWYTVGEVRNEMVLIWFAELSFENVIQIFTWTTFIGGILVPVSYVKDLVYTSVEQLFLTLV